VLERSSPIDVHERIILPRRFLIVTKAPTGAIEVHGMKDWLKKHPEQMPATFTPLHKTSHQLRNELRRMGWIVEETADEVRLMRPDMASDPNALSVLDEAGADAAEEEEFAFSLESHLRDFIAHNVGTLPNSHKKLKLYVDDQKRGGIEYPTAVGPIDILAVTGEGNFVVFELKLTKGPDKTMGQLLRYMGWVKKNLAHDRDVYGVIVAKDMDQKLRYAALLVPSVSLLEYEVDFRLKAADLNALPKPE
jgi:endonuclease